MKKCNNNNNNNNSPLLSHTRPIPFFPHLLSSGHCALSFGYMAYDHNICTARTHRTQGGKKRDTQKESPDPFPSQFLESQLLCAIFLFVATRLAYEIAFGSVVIPMPLFFCLEQRGKDPAFYLLLSFLLSHPPYIVPCSLFPPNGRHYRPCILSSEPQIAN